MTTNERLAQLWALLVETAHAQRVLTYDILAQMVGLPEQAIGCYLRPIHDYCNYHDLPPLTLLALNDTDAPRESEFEQDGDVFGERERIYHFDWFSLKSPQPEDFLKVTTKGTNEMTYYSSWFASLNLMQQFRSHRA